MFDFKSKIYIKTLLAWVILMITPANFVFAQENNSLKNITSKKSAEAVSEKIEVAESESEDNALKLHSLGVGIGQTFLNGDFELNGDDSITGDLYYTYSASHSFDLSVNAHHSSHKISDRKLELSGVAVGIKGKAYQFDSFSPFVLGGLGFYAPKTKRMVSGTLKNSKSKIVFGTHLGFGVELRLNRHFLIGIMAHLHNPFDVKQELDPEVEGSYHKLLITTSYTF